MRIGVTGASSGIGQAVLAAAADAGHDAVPFGRNPTSLGASARRYAIGDPVTSRDLAGLDAVVHLAWSWVEAPAANTAATAALATSASEAGARVVILSTFSAFSARNSAYGAAKLAAEESVGREGGHAIRSGLIWGGRRATGMVGKLSRLAGLPLVAPRLLPDPLIFVSEAAILAGHLVDAAGGSPRVAPALGAAPDPVPLSAILAARRRGRRIPLPVPARLAHGSALLAERLSLPLPFRADSLAALDARPPRGTDLPWLPDFPGPGRFLDWVTIVES